MHTCKEFAAIIDCGLVGITRSECFQHVASNKGQKSGTIKYNTLTYFQEKKSQQTNKKIKLSSTLKMSPAGPTVRLLV